jgi:soluble lytic murein transglycosylase-like protein
MTARFTKLVSRMRGAVACATAAYAFTFAIDANAGAQIEEKLVPSVQSTLATAIADRGAPRLVGDPRETQAWLAEMSTRLSKRIPDPEARTEFLITVQYEASRAGLDPQLVLAVITHESAFRKYAISSASARGYMQVMPFWVRLIGSPEHNLFHLRTNLRYGCVILRHYLDIEKGDVVRALARYNGSLGKFDYPNTVLGFLERQWRWSPPKIGVPAPEATVPATAVAPVKP